MSAAIISNPSIDTSNLMTNKCDKCDYEGIKKILRVFFGNKN